MTFMEDAWTVTSSFECPSAAVGTGSVPQMKPGRGAISGREATGESIAAEVLILSIPQTFLLKTGDMRNHSLQPTTDFCLLLVKQFFTIYVLLDAVLLGHIGVFLTQTEMMVQCN